MSSSAYVNSSETSILINIKLCLLRSENVSETSHHKLLIILVVSYSFRYIAMLCPQLLIGVRRETTKMAF
jgi:hypothetical protein